MRPPIAVILVFLYFCTSGCVVQAPVVPPLAFLYTSIEAPLDLDFHNTPPGRRRGESSCVSILGLVSFGDAGIQAAAKQGGLERIDGADYKFLSVLGPVFTKYSTVVYGE
jgi:hypothetical protein